ncbi:MAG: hypothetical protein QOJ03_1729 [Frankiaceae bacterium]|jgi:hypothetical protein|nr:hypothetical protein [Frankiaceae bacterium]
MSESVSGWLAGRLPDDWFVEAPQITVDRDEVLIVGRLAPVAPEQSEPDQSERDQNGAEQGRIARFREDTREQRIRIAREAEHRFGRKIAWGARCGDSTVVFTTLSVPVMTRLRQPERLVLDTLVDSGVARSRSDALAWCVRLVGRHTDDWLRELRTAMESVQRVRDAGPEAASA